MTSDPTNMEAVKIALEAILREASFDVESTEITHDGRNKPIDSQRVSAPQLREVYFAEEESLVERRVSKNVPEELMSELADCLRVVLERVIDPETDRIGHAFQLNKYSGGGVSTRADGLKQVEYTSQLQEFADAPRPGSGGSSAFKKQCDCWRHGNAESRFNREYAPS